VANQTKSGASSRAWLFTWTTKGKRREMGLGSYSSVSLSRARTLADEQRKLVAQGRDPIAERNMAKAKVEAELSFRQCVDKVFAKESPDWRSAKHKQQWVSSLRNHARALLDLPIGVIETKHVLAVLEPIWRSKTNMADRVRARIEQVLDWAKAAEYRSGENPARWRGHMKELLAKKAKKPQHHPAMEFAEVPGFVAALRQEQAIPAKAVTTRALEFLILTAARSVEVMGMRWGEVDLQRKLWVVPGSRMKNGRQHSVPLSDRAVAILRELKHLPDNPHVFPGTKRGRGLSPRALSMALERMQDSVTVHGFRASFRTWSAERTNYPREICEVALAHTVGNDTERAYQRGDLLDKRRRLMDEWAKYLTKPPSKGGDVVPLRRGAR
jgi:integrase